MEAVTLFAQLVLAAVALALLVTLGVRAIRFAKKGTPGAQMLGSALLLVTPLGNFRDPTNEMVEQAKQVKQREEDDSGDPPDDADRGDGAGGADHA